MSPTTTEKRITQRRKARGILVPILEDLLERPVQIEDDEDIEFMERLMRARMKPREKGVFSPSLLSSCMRQAYFVKTGQERRPALSSETNGYFLDGDFRHYKWQFALWKAHRAGKLELIECELRVHNAAGDFVGTIDALVRIPHLLGTESLIVDFKGMNVRSFLEFVKNGIQLGHGVQIVGYSMIVGDIDGALLVAESKAGPVQSGSPIALHEELVTVPQFKAKVKKRLATLRRHVDNEEVPPPACVSTRHKEFQECPFSYYCLKEVKVIQRQRERAARSNTQKPKVAVSTRNGNDRPARSTGRRKKRAR